MTLFPMDSILLYPQKIPAVQAAHSFCYNIFPSRGLGSQLFDFPII